MNSTVFCALIIAAVLIAQTTADCKEGKKIMKTGEKRYITCGIETCEEDGSLSATSCGTYQCAEGKEIGYKVEDRTKVYPDCCGGPICKD